LLELALFDSRAGYEPEQNRAKYTPLDPYCLLQPALFESRVGYEPEQNRAKYAPYPGPLLLC